MYMSGRVQSSEHSMRPCRSCATGSWPAAWTCRPSCSAAATGYLCAKVSRHWSHTLPSSIAQLPCVLGYRYMFRDTVQHLSMTLVVNHDSRLSIETISWHSHTRALLSFHRLLRSREARRSHRHSGAGGDREAALALLRSGGGAGAEDGAGSAQGELRKACPSGTRCMYAR
jgi:hypothetical protein